MLEKPIERSILDYLQYRSGGYFFKVNNTGIYDQAKRKYRTPAKYDVAGKSDIMGVYRGIFVALEVKTPKTRKRVSEHQRLFLNNIKRNGGIGEVVCSIDEVKVILDDLDQKIFNKVLNHLENTPS